MARAEMVRAVMRRPHILVTMPAVPLDGSVGSPQTLTEIGAGRYRVGHVLLGRGLDSQPVSIAVLSPDVSMEVRLVLNAHGPGVFVLCDRMFPVPVSGISVEGEDALVVACVIAAGVGDVGEAFPADGADDEVADDGAGAGLVPGAGFLGVFAEGDVA